MAKGKFSLEDPFAIIGTVVWKKKDKIGKKFIWEIHFR